MIISFSDSLVNFKKSKQYSKVIHIFRANSIKWEQYNVGQAVVVLLKTTENRHNRGSINIYRNIIMDCLGHLKSLQYKARGCVYV